MRSIAVVLFTALLGACGSSTDSGPTRYNFAVIAGENQSSTAGSSTLPQAVTSQLTRDPEGEFASRAIDLLLPVKAFAQGISLPGVPIEGQLVCGEESAPGEPKVVPLCAFTLQDGKAANIVQPGTIAGVYKIRFTAQVPSQMPVKDSTTVTVEAGPVASNGYVSGITLHGLSPFAVDNGSEGHPSVTDVYGNRVPYRLVVTGPAHTESAVLGDPAARTVIADPEGLCSDDCEGDISTRPEHFGTVAVVTKTGTIATGTLTVMFNNPGWLIRLGEWQQP